MKSSLIKFFNLAFLLTIFAASFAQARLLAKDVQQCAQAVYGRPLPVTTFNGRACFFYVNARGAYTLDLSTHPNMDFISEKGSPLLVNIPPDPPTCVLWYGMSKYEAQSSLAACPAKTKTVGYSKVEDKDLLTEVGPADCVLAKAISELEDSKPNSKEEALSRKTRIDQIEKECKDVLDAIRERDRKDEYDDNVISKAKADLTQRFNIQFTTTPDSGADAKPNAGAD